MLCIPNADNIESVHVSKNVTLVPRLEYSHVLLNSIIDILKIKKDELKNLNRNFIELDDDDHTYVKALDFELTIVFSLEILSVIQKRMNAISGINSIPKLLPPTIPMIRTVSAQLFTLLPSSSQTLSELSVQLGSIILDSAILTEARFNFGQSNIESALILNEVKLMVDSKISKQYPNLDFFKAPNT